MRPRLDRFLQFLGGAEGNLLARLDLDRLAGRGIATHAGGALADLQDSQPADAIDALTAQGFGGDAARITQRLKSNGFE